MPRFRVEVGDRISHSRVLEDDDEPRENARVVSNIPGEYKQLFREDVDQALRDIAGVATFNVSPLIRDRQSIFDAIRDNMTHPFTKKMVMLDYQDDVTLDEYFVTSSMCHIVESRWVPRINPTHTRFVHGDLSLSGDCAGLAMAHVSGMVKRQRPKPDGTVSIFESPFIVVDFMLQIVPPPGSEIDLAKIRSFILYLSKLFPVALATFDGFQSAAIMQALNKSGLQSKLQSIDKKDVPYLTLRNAHFERRIATYHYDPYIEEVLYLERDIVKQKVDHPPKRPDGGKGSKDVSDAVCGAVYACMTDKRAIVGVPLFDEEAVKERAVDPGEAKSQQEKSRIKTLSGKQVDFERMRDGFGE
jgi:hypothetical protein